MTRYLEEFNPPDRLLLGPGPSTVHPRVLKAMTAPVLGHLDPVFFQCMDDVYEMLKLMFKTSSSMTLPISSTGTGGMETAVCNAVEPGDVMVIAVNGYFGHRMVDVARRAGADVHVLEFPFGAAVDPEEVAREMDKHAHVKALGVVHGETSTGVLSPIAPLSDLAHRHGALIIVDAVSSLGGEEFAMDAWDLDICYSASQKCLGAPPGLSPISIGPRASEIIRTRETPVQSFYFNLADLEEYWSGSRAYHHTTPISMVYALRESLRMAMEEGLDKRIERHARCATALRAGLEGLGMQLFADANHRSNPLTTVFVPQGVDGDEVRRQLREDYNIEIAAGIGETRNKIWRIGLMGESCQETNVLRLISALERILGGLKVPLEPGAGVSAVQASLAA